MDVGFLIEGLSDLVEVGKVVQSVRFDFDAAFVMLLGWDVCLH